MKAQDAYPSRWLGHANFNVPRVLTIKHVEMVGIDGDDGTKEDKPVVYFHEHPKGLVLNKTNFLMLAALLGEDSDSWKDGECEVYKDMTSYKGKPMPCVRIHAVGQQAEPAQGFDDAPASDRVPEEDIPF